MTVFGWVQAGVGQYARKDTASKGPRAIGLLQLSANGKATLLPISIMVNGKFYDAAAYKAAPVPMALESGTVYEALRTGKSLGLFTVTSALTGNGRWLGAGTWLAAGATPPSTAHKAETSPRLEEEEGPPVLRKGSPKPPEDKPESKPSSPATASEPTPTPAKPAASPTSVTAPTATPEPTAPEDADRPELRRGAPPKTASTSKKVAAVPSGDKNAKAAAAPPAKRPTAPAPAVPDLQLVPAISDSGGPEPRSYSYDMKPEEEQAFRKKMLALAAGEIRKKAEETHIVSTGSASNRKRANTGKLLGPNFQDVQLHVLDVGGNNEPVLVLTAKAGLPQTGQANSPEYYITLVTRSDLYGELRKLFSAVTDQGHLDVTPRMELIDAVDADGDSRGELLFREISDAGSAYVIYRVGADQLWALYEGTASR